MSTNQFPRMHVSLYVSDIAKTVNFYTSFFGQPADKIKLGYAKYILDNPSLIISFVENKNRVQPNFGHLGFQVETEAILHERLAETQLKRIEVLEEMGTNCCYAVQDKFWVTDPDGHQWEVYYFHNDAEFNDPHYASEDNAVCCMPNSEIEQQAKPKIKLAALQGQSCSLDSGCC